MATVSVVVCDQSIYIPNAFTPNGDNINDLFQIFSALPLKYFDLKVFDRWGEKVYESEDETTGWDGSYKGAKEPSGIYTYEATIVSINGESANKKGSLTLIR
jgi:gliding motility-associated-like protein